VVLAVVYAAAAWLSAEDRPFALRALLCLWLPKIGIALALGLVLVVILELEEQLETAMSLSRKILFGCRRNNNQHCRALLHSAIDAYSYHVHVLADDSHAQPHCQPQSNNPCHHTATARPFPRELSHKRESGNA
jgi:hypothetical protein